MASSSSIHQLEEHGDEEGENDDRHGSQITSPLRILTSLFPCSGKWDSYCSVRFISVLCPCHAVQPSSRRRRGSPEKEEREVGDDDDSSPIEQVALTVPVGDDPATPVLTFRMWVLGTASCAALSFLNAFFGYRKEPLTITAVSAQIAVLPLGRLMAAALPEGAFFQGRPWEFTLNPGPFNMKEHVLITIFANAGAGTVFGMNLVTSVRVFYGQHMSFLVALIIILTSQVSEVNEELVFLVVFDSHEPFQTSGSLDELGWFGYLIVHQVLGFGWAGIFRRYLVEPAAMWWPSNLVQVSLFRYSTPSISYYTL